MGVRVAAGKRENVESAIESGVIPNDSLIITKDAVDSGLMFYDANGNLISITEKTRFTTFTEAQAYIKAYGYPGLFVSVQNGTEWVPYIVQEDSSLKPIGVGGTADLSEVMRIDGGSAAGHVE